MTAAAWTAVGGCAPSAADVKRANRRLYDAVAGDYEAIDGRRGASLESWIRSRLRGLAMRHGNGVLLDLGSGSGVVARAARGVFVRTIALDISPRILAAAGWGTAAPGCPAFSTAPERVAADLDELPIADESVDVVSCFAVLHHLYDTCRLAAEAARVLRPGGAFWSDHDMDVAFHRRFRWPLAVYRRLRRSRRRYIERTDAVDAATYDAAEVHEDGVDADAVLHDLRAAGLDARAAYHGYGLSRWSDRLFGEAERPRGSAPLLSIVAIKTAPGFTCGTGLQPVEVCDRFVTGRPPVQTTATPETRDTAGCSSAKSIAC